MYQRQVTFTEAIKMALQQNYCNFAGRASRSEYWWFALFSSLIGIVIGFIFSAKAAEIISTVVSLALLLPSLGLSVRRLHDTGRSGWFVLLGIIPVVGWIILIVWFCQNSQMTPNQYGPVPHVNAPQGPF